MTQVPAAFSTMNISGRHSCIVNVKRCFQEQRKLIARAFDTPLEPNDHVRRALYDAQQLFFADVHAHRRSRTSRKKSRVDICTTAGTTSVYALDIDKTINHAWILFARYASEQEIITHANVA